MSLYLKLCKAAKIYPDSKNASEGEKCVFTERRQLGPAPVTLLRARHIGPHSPAPVTEVDQALRHTVIGWKSHPPGPSTQAGPLPCTHERSPGCVSSMI